MAAGNRVDNAEVAAGGGCDVYIFSAMPLFVQLKSQQTVRRLSRHALLLHLPTPS
jgi:hypothetical protein